MGFTDLSSSNWDESHMSCIKTEIHKYTVLSKFHHHATSSTPSLKKLSQAVKSLSFHILIIKKVNVFNKVLDSTHVFHSIAKTFQFRSHLDSYNFHRKVKIVRSTQPFINFHSIVNFHDVFHSIRRHKKLTNSLIRVILPMKRWEHFELFGKSLPLCFLLSSPCSVH